MGGEKTFQDIASALEAESDVRGLVGTLLRTLLQQVGATRVYLLRHEPSSIRVVARVSDGSQAEFPSLPLEACPELAQQIIRRVACTGEDAVSLHDEAPALFGEALGAATHPKYITCIPIMGLDSILYFETASALASSASEDLRNIRVLATFAAGAFEYARMYEALQGRADFLQSAIDAMPAHIAIVDSNGTIVAVNGAWRRFAEGNGLTLPNFGVGASYLAVCDRADLEEARRIGAGIRTVIARSAPNFFSEYECHSPAEQRWFQVRVRPFREDGSVLVVHQSISEVKRAQAELQQALAEVAQLKNQLQVENLYLQEEIKSEYNFEDIVGESDELRRVFHKLEQVAATDATVLVLGETGTGKELLARAVHSRSPRREHPLVKVNCAALPANLIESELFGHEKGAFSGALNQRIGRFEVANHGTIFLDEIGDLALELQAKLLRVLQEGEFERLGSSKPIKVDVRVIAATNCDLERAVAESKFRSDLYYRLNVFPITVPPLRSRKSDIPLLVRHFIEKSQARIGKKITTVSRQLMDALVAYAWPGNIRELENVIERAVILSKGPLLTFDEPLGRFAKSTPVADHDEKLETVERVHIIKVLEETGWKLKGKGNAAERLGLNPSTLRSRISKLGITRPTRDSPAQ